MEAIEKKVYNSTTNDKSGLRALYQYWLKNHNGRNLFTFLNKFSRVDALFQSGSSTVIVEYKERRFSIAQYRDGFLLERDKFENLKKASSLFSAPSCYIVDYTDACVIHQIREESDYIWTKMLLPSDQHKNVMVEKEVCVVPFLGMADFIIGKRTWERATYEQLEKYFRKVDDES